MSKVRIRPVSQPAGLTISATYKPEGRLPLEKGRTFQVTGERGRFRFIKHVQSHVSGTQWVDCVRVDKHGKALGGVRSFDPVRIKRVNRK